MKIKIICVGNLKEKHWCDAQKEYLKRLSRFCEVDICELSEKNQFVNPASILEAESESIIKQLTGHVVTLEIDAKQKSSEEFSSFIENVKLRGESKICFVIGSSYGLSDKVKALADTKLSFSKMTFPHQLMRVVLLEQIYRAFCISNNITYHK